MSRAGCWTITMACEQFAKQGMPVDMRRFRLAVTRVAKIPPAGEMPSGERGGRGQFLYPIGELQKLHAALSPWLTAAGHRVTTCPDCSGPTEPKPRYDWCPACRSAITCACPDCSSGNPPGPVARPVR